MALVPTVNRLAGSRMLGHLCRLRPIVTRPSVYVLRYKAAQLSALHSCDASPLLPLRRTNLLDSLPMAPEISYSVRSYSKKVKKEKNKGMYTVNPVFKVAPVIKVAPVLLNLFLGPVFTNSPKAD